MQSFGVSALCLGLMAGAAFAGPQEIYDAMQMDALVEVLQEEMLQSAQEIAQDYGVRQPPAGWEAALADIYDLEALQSEIRAASLAALEGRAFDWEAVEAQVQGFAPVYEAELAARKALLSADLEAEAIDRAAIALADEVPQMRQIAEYIAKADLVERNLAAGLNSNLAFQNGLQAGLGLPLTSAGDLVRAQVDPMRVLLAEWLHGAYLLSYAPLSDEMRAAYFDFMTSPEGAAITEMMIQGADPVFETLSYELGLAVAQWLFGVEL